MGNISNTHSGGQLTQEDAELELFRPKINKNIINEERLEEYLQNSFKIYSLLPIVDYNIDHPFTYVYTPFKQTLRMYLDVTEVNEQLALKIIQKLIAVIFELRQNLNLTLDTIYLHVTQEGELNLQIHPNYFSINNENCLNQLGKLWYLLLMKQEYVNQPLIFPVHNNIRAMLQPNSQIEQFQFLIQNHYHSRQKAEFDSQLQNYEAVKQMKDKIDELQQQSNQLKYKNIWEVKIIQNLHVDCQEQYFLLISNLRTNIRRRQFQVQSTQFLTEKIQKITGKINTALLTEQVLIQQHNSKLAEYKSAIQEIIDKVLELRDICSQFQVQNQDIERFHDSLIQTKNDSNIFRSILQSEGSYESIICQINQTNKIQQKKDDANNELEFVVRNMMEMQQQQHRVYLDQKLEQIQEIKKDLQNFDISQERFLIASKLSEVNELKQQKLQEINIDRNNFDIPDAVDYSLARYMNSNVKSYLQLIKNKVLQMTQKIQEANRAKDDLRNLGVYQPRNESEFQQNLQSLKEQFLDPHPFDLAMIADRKESGYQEILKQKIRELLNL